jgi:hypothetical protein
MLDTRDLADELADEDTEAERAAFIAELFEDFGIDPERPDDMDVVIIEDGEFEEYAQDLAEDIGAIGPGAPWPVRCIDWAQAASELQQDYTSTTIAGTTYWFRAC